MAFTHGRLAGNFAFISALNQELFAADGWEAAARPVHDPRDN